MADNEFVSEVLATEFYEREKMLVAPLISGKKVLGIALVADPRVKYTYDSLDVAEIDMLASSAAPVLEKLRFAEQLAAKKRLRAEGLE